MATLCLICMYVRACGKNFMGHALLLNILDAFPYIHIYTSFPVNMYGCRPGSMADMKQAAAVELLLYDLMCACLYTGYRYLLFSSLTHVQNEDIIDIQFALGKTVTSDDTTFPMCNTLMQHSMKYVSHVPCLCVCVNAVGTCGWFCVSVCCTQFVLVSLILQIYRQILSSPRMYGFGEKFNCVK